MPVGSCRCLWPPLSVLSGGGEVILKCGVEVVNDGDTPRPPQQLPANAHEGITELKLQVSDFRMKYTVHSTVCNESSGILHYDCVLIRLPR